MTNTWMTTAEVAAYLRLRERKVYELVRQRLIPCTKVTGKLLFPKQAIDLWLMNHLEGDQRASRPVPPVLAGSQDPLLDWALRESGSELAQLCHGSGDGVQRLLAGDAMLAGIHVRHAEDASYNDPDRLGLGGMRDLVIIHWARRQQGLLLPAGNPRGINRLEDLASRRLRVASRQPEAGASTLFRQLLADAGLEPGALQLLPHPALSEDDLALEVRSGRADAGLGVRASAVRHGLHFIPLQTEWFDLAMRRRSYFDPRVQRLFGFARSERFRQRAEAMEGYDVSDLGAIRYNA
ncbi:MAG: helix-turn-helix transcriptional regulator [Ectothiorhodospiraceae bacterium]|nr:helix-turn-helix transcriptional regulator [Ectothiorhodospiraceae bacterium]